MAWEDLGVDKMIPLGKRYVYIINFGMKRCNNIICSILAGYQTSLAFEAKDARR